MKFRQVQSDWLGVFRTRLKTTRKNRPYSFRPLKLFLLYARNVGGSYRKKGRRGRAGFKRSGWNRTLHEKKKRTKKPPGYSTRRAISMATSRFFTTNHSFWPASPARPLLPLHTRRSVLFSTKKLLIRYWRSIKKKKPECVEKKTIKINIKSNIEY